MREAPDKTKYHLSSLRGAVRSSFRIRMKGLIYQLSSTVITNRHHSFIYCYLGDTATREELMSVHIPKSSHFRERVTPRR